MRIAYRPGYRVYFVQRGKAALVLLAGGDKAIQHADIAAALALAWSLYEPASCQA